MGGIVVGIDVGGSKKGFHLAAANDTEIVALLNSSDIAECCSWVDLFNPLAIAIDAPRRSKRTSQTTRAAERHMRKMGYRVQWTPFASSPQEWMARGEALWSALERYPCYEAFPTAARVEEARLNLPIRLLAGQENRSTFKDYVDACICASVAQRIVLGIALSTESDDDGPIYY